MSWPTPQDFNEAVQNPYQNFSDPELKTGQPELNTIGLPQANTGAFASVYQIRCENRSVAMRCFLRNIEDRQKRYIHLSNFIRQANCAYTVGCDFIEKGISVRSSWYPILKMDWVEGESLERHLAGHIRIQGHVQQLANNFSDMVADLQHLEVAHGDLQHGNIMIWQNQLRLVDYDGMFVPDLAGMQANEIGHPNYQHPGRNKFQFDKTIDRFSSWVIHGSLRLLALDPCLSERINAFEECLLFRHADYANPARSLVFALLESHENAEVQNIGRVLRSLCQMPPDCVPVLGELDEISEPVEINAPKIIEHSQRKQTYATQTLPTVNQRRESVSFEEHAVRVDPTWPTAQEYINAAHSPRNCFNDEDLAGGSGVYGPGGLLREQGKNGIVFCIRSHRAGSPSFAVKCFLQPDPTRDERYEMVSRYLAAFPWYFWNHLIKCDYLKKGILIGDVWYPIVKMPWVKGETLDKFVKHARPNKHLFLAFTNQWRELCQLMKVAQVAHGNLAPTNIIVSDGNLKLIDYDSFYIPSFKDKQYRPVDNQEDLKHPRNTGLLGPGMDNFSAWLIDTELLAMAYDPDIWDLTIRPRGTLLFQASDLASPQDSKLMGLLHHNHHKELRQRASLLFKYLFQNSDSIPDINSNALDTVKDPKAAAKALTRRQSALAGTAVFSGVAFMVLIAFGHAMGNMAWLIGLIACIWTIFDVIRVYRRTKKP